MKTLLEVRDLKKEYDDARAVDGISFTVGEGEIVGLLGPNGAGKTTTISMLLGLLTPTAGSIFVFGKDLAHERSSILARVNFSAVYAQLPGNLSVRENLEIFARLYGVKNRKERISALIKEFDLDRFSKTRSSFLSSGEQSRLNLAKALLNDPKLLLLDEPTASLDPSSADIIRTRIRDFAKEQHAGILWTSHDMREITEVCNRVLFISHGKILLEGNPKILPGQHGKKDLEELFITIAREPLSLKT